jgi:hypothetical protein
LQPSGVGLEAPSLPITLPTLPTTERMALSFSASCQTLHSPTAAKRAFDSIDHDNQQLNTISLNACFETPTHVASKGSKRRRSCPATLPILKPTCVLTDKSGAAPWGIRKASFTFGSPSCAKALRHSPREPKTARQKKTTGAEEPVET